MAKSILTAIMAGIIIIVAGALFFFIPNTIYYTPVDKSSVQFEICPPYCGGTVSADEVILSEILGAELSIVRTDVVFSESDQNAFEKFRDEENPPIIGTTTPTFTLEISASLLAPTGEIVSKNSYLNIPVVSNLLSLTDKQGNVLAGSAQIGFSGKTTEDVEINAEGTVEYWLDDRLIATKKIFFTPNGIRGKSFEMFMGDSVTSTIIYQPEKRFTFKFTDEQFEDSSTHTFRVIVKNFDVETITDDKRKKYNWAGEFLAYQVQMTVDKSKISIVDEAGNNISVFKDDNKLILCDVKTHGFETKNKPPVITIVRKDDNQKLGTIDINKIQSTQNIIYEEDGQKSCAVLPDLQRNTDYLLLVEGKNYEIHTPTVQQNYLIYCSALAVDTNTRSDLSEMFAYAGDKCTSTFLNGWDFIFDARSNNIIKLDSIWLKVCGADKKQIYTTNFDGLYGRVTVSSVANERDSPVVEVYDGIIKIGETGGKTYCTFLKDLPQSKKLLIKIPEITDVGTTVEPNPSYPALGAKPYNYFCVNNSCGWSFINLPNIPQNLIEINTPLGSKEFAVTCSEGYGNIIPDWVYYNNPNIAPRFQPSSHAFGCTFQ